MGNGTREHNFHITTPQCCTEDLPIFPLNLRPPAFPLKSTDESHIHPHHKWELESRLGYSLVVENLFSMHDTPGSSSSIEEKKPLEIENTLGWALTFTTPQSNCWPRLISPLIEAVRGARAGNFYATGEVRTLLFLVILHITLRPLIYAVGLHLHPPPPPEPDWLFYCSFPKRSWKVSPLFPSLN